MTDTLFSDISEFNNPVDNSYPYRFISFRSNDGTYEDKHLAHNLAWAKAACASNKLDGFIVYFVWEPNWQQTVATFKAMVGTPHPKMAIMIDVENWSGRIGGNQSAGINAARESLIFWLGGNRNRVFGYGNVSDLNNLWPQKGDAKVIVAAYGSNPSYPNKIAHQFADNYNTPPFGPSDINSADGLSPAQFAAELGLVTAPAPASTNPTGHLDEIFAGSGNVTVRGWAYDPDQKSTNIPIRIYEDGKYIGAENANAPRPDVNRIVGIPGDHGFNFTSVASPGIHSYTVYAINVLGGSNIALGTKILTVPKPAPAPKPVPAPVPTPPPAPKPVPVPTPVVPNPFPFVAGKEVDMILVQTDPKSWPADAWPGVFLLANNTLKHVAHQPDVVAYQKAGVPGVITISNDEFLGYPNVTQNKKLEAPVEVPAHEQTLDLEVIPGTNAPTN